MKDFSLFEYALKCASASRAEDLGRVAHVSRREFAERETFLFRAQSPCLEYLCLLVESALLLRTNRRGRVYAGFERLSRMEAVVDGYLRIADLSERLYVFGECDWQPPRHPNMRVIALPDEHSLAREWFLLAESPTLHAAIVARRTNEDRARTQDGREFRALKSHDPALVKRVVAAAENLVDRSLAA